MAETVRHKQIPVYFDQMVDDVFLNGLAEGPATGAAEARRGAAASWRALPPVQQLRRQNDSVNAPIAMFSRHNGGWTVVFSIADPTLGISWRLGEAGDFRETGFIGYARSADPQADAQSVDRTAGRCAGGRPSRCAMSMPVARCRARSRSASIRRPR